MKNPVKISSAEVILLVSFCYYMTAGVVATTSLAAFTNDIEVIQREQMKYFICEQRGHDISNPCNTTGFENISEIFTVIGYLLLILYPFVHLVYVLNIKWLRRKCKSCCCRTLKERRDPATATSSK